MSTPPDELRIGDAERERAQAALADHYAAGRLDHDEYTERLDRIWAARTGSDLRPVFVDLPGSTGGRPYSAPADRMTPPRARTRPRVPGPVLVLLAVLVALTVVTHLPVILIGLGVWFFLLRGRWRSPQRRW